MSTISSTQQFKKITVANLRELDDTTTVWIELTSIAKTPEQWLQFFQAPQCTAKVPSEVVGLLEVARGSMIYGIFFYPLATAGAEQCWRVLETGVRRRCEQLGLRTRSFNENLDALLGSGQFDHATRDRLDHIRRLRNSASHPDRQTILDPAQAQQQLALTVQFLNQLFP